MWGQALVFGALPVAVLSAAIGSSPATLDARQTKQVNWTTEYSTPCKKCPYSLCTNVVIAEGDLALTCWTTGEEIGDTDTWLRTSDGCYVSEYDLLEYTGDFTEDLNYCGKVPLQITKDDAEVKYLSECKWTPSTSAESIKYYGRDKDLTVTCWVEGSSILGNKYWYKTTDNCHVSETGLYGVPDRGTLENCGPNPGPRQNESESDPDDERRSLSRPVSVSEDTAAPETPARDLSRRWLQEGLVGEEYAPCRSCASKNSTCKTQKVYEYNQTVISQCMKDEETVYPNGTFSMTYWMLTTDWCYVDSLDFWEPPYDHYRYPGCHNWGL